MLYSTPRIPVIMFRYCILVTLTSLLFIANQFDQYFNLMTFNVGKLVINNPEFFFISHSLIIKQFPFDCGTEANESVDVNSVYTSEVLILMHLTVFTVSWMVEGHRTPSALINQQEAFTSNRQVDKMWRNNF